RVMNTERRDQRELGGAIGRGRIDQQQARIEVAALGDERTTTPAAPCRLLRRRDPQCAVLAPPCRGERLGIGGSDAVVKDQPKPGGNGGGIELHALRTMILPRRPPPR